MQIEVLLSSSICIYDIKTKEVGLVCYESL